MAGTLTLDRRQWLGYRWRRHGFDGQISDERLGDLLLLGFQSSRQGGSAQALMQRTRRAGPAIGPGGPLVSFWSVRGAPHAHPLAQLDVVRDALAPLATDEGGAAHVEAVGEVAAALLAVVTAPMAKGDASTQVTKLVPALADWCLRCESRHVPDGLFRAGGRQAQVVLGPEDQRTTMLHPPPAHQRATVAQPRRLLLSTYFRVNGPASRAQFRDWMESDTGAVASLWKACGDLVRVQVEGRRCEAPESLLDELRDARAPSGVVLVPPNDPYLRQVDRALLVPDRTRRQAVWRAVAGPGALLADGEVAGTWRYRRTSRDLTITPFTDLGSARRDDAERSAQLLAAAIGDDQPKIAWA